jgi:hypothetical protein
MSHYIEPNGLFDHHCRQLIAQGINLSWGDRFGRKNKNQKMVVLNIPVLVAS